jgi:hypothetical protein
MGFIGPSITVGRNQTFVDPGALQSLFVPGGQIHTEGRKVQRTIRTQARSAAPVRSGLLRRSIVASQVGTIRYGVEFSVYAWANHALFVEDGTRGNGAGLIWGNPYMKLYGGGRLQGLGTHQGPRPAGPALPARRNAARPGDARVPAMNTRPGIGRATSPGRNR